MKKIHILCIGIFLLCIIGCSEEESIPQELKVIETHADFDCKFPILGCPLLDGRQQAPV